MSDPPDFRLEHSELRGDDEFAEFSNVDLPYFSDWRGSFEKLAWATDDTALAAAHARSGWPRPRGRAIPRGRSSSTPSRTRTSPSSTPATHPSFPPPRTRAP